LIGSLILTGLALFLVAKNDRLTPIVLGSLVLSLLVSYIRAKAESLQIECSSGIAERTERLIIALVAIGFEGLGVPYSLALGIWLLFLLAAVTVIQRILIVKAAL
jgi:CDP-diacylglycerol--glycerol-3-phosphate 3-phosphatidyltransferase